MLTDQYLQLATPPIRRSYVITRYCALCGEEFTQTVQRSNNARVTCGDKCRSELHTHNRLGSSVKRRRDLVLSAAKKTARIDSTVSYGDIAKELGWPKHRVARIARELKSQGRWPHKKAVSSPPRIKSTIECDGCGQPFFDPEPWNDRPHRYCTVKCANTTLGAVRRIQKDKLRRIVA